MVNTETRPDAEVSDVGATGVLGDVPFTSFSDDLEHLDSFLEGSWNAVNETDDCLPHDAFATVEPGEESMCSPTTLASDLLHEPSHEVVEHETECPSSSDGRRYNFDAALSVAYNSVSAAQPKQLWETGVWKYIFGDRDATLDFDVWGPQATRPTPAAWGLEQASFNTAATAGGKRSHAQSCNFMDVVSFKPDVPWKDQREADLQRSINMWVAVTSKWDEECFLVHKLNEMRNESEQFNMFAHVFSGRAPVTIRKRGTSILKICDHLEEHHPEPFPMRELTFYRFLCSERMTGAPASRLKGFLQAITFCRHVLEVTELQDVLESRRCRGVALEDCPRERKQASPLTVAELKRLHAVIDEGTDQWDTVFAGAALLCCYCRGRWGDLMRSEMAFLDYDENWKPAFLETRTGRHKTMSSQMHRHQYLPMVAPVQGVNGADWASPWIKMRDSMGLLLPPDGLIMPAPNKLGEPSQRPLESGECGKWLRRLLQFDGTAESSSDRRISSHSLKCTMLSYAAKRGLSVPDRLMLGYHSSHFHMALVYSRDGAAASLLLLEKLIDEIVKGQFRPDSTRSGRLVDAPAQSSEPQRAETKVEVVESSAEENAEEVNSDSSESTSSSDSSSDEIPPDHNLNKTFAPPEPPAGFVRWQHSKLKTVHLAEEHHTKVFVCGRAIGSFHHRVSANPRFDSPVCWACFKKAK
eukprot:s4229_g6.t1